MSPVSKALVYLLTYCVEDFSKQRNKNNPANDSWSTQSFTGRPGAFRKWQGEVVLNNISFPRFCCLHVFIHHSGQKQPDTSFYNQPGTAGILTHSAQKAHPLQSTYFKCTSRLSELQPGNLAQDERLLS